jgi:hypothetical protein
MQGRRKAMSTVMARVPGRMGLVVRLAACLLFCFVIYNACA